MTCRALGPRSVVPTWLVIVDVWACVGSRARSGKRRINNLSAATSSVLASQFPIQLCGPCPNDTVGITLRVMSNSSGRS